MSQLYSFLASRMFLITLGRRNMFLRVFISSLSVVRYIEEREREVRTRNVFMIVFNGSMKYRVCACAASLVGKESSKETKWIYEKEEKTARVVGRARELCSPYVVKVTFAG